MSSRFFNGLWHCFIGAGISTLAVGLFLGALDWVACGLFLISAGTIALILRR